MEQQHQHSKRKRKPVFVFGNYKNYYGYRIGQDLHEDPRLNVFKKELFEDKECLDIGCNSGIITILIAKKFRCRSILGIDIDSDRIEDANWHLKKFERAGKTHAKASKLEISRSANGSEQSVASSPNEEMMEISRDCSSTETNLFHMVSFQQENFVQSRCPPEKKYDTILCLSVTKWVHLNWGDDGLITLFSKIWRLLRPTTAMNYRSILFRPAKFQEILLDKIGFRKVEDITSHLSGSKAGFNRPILVFHK
ncbi:hypothetical protein SO802_019652 [Lithocarpus litseifolius]|uniref:RNA methyltransferase n=1 Tax=Lithocarpus litseifolius TaxID=425828 RepID=A0AAW2CS77_9ROSI